MFLAPLFPYLLLLVLMPGEGGLSSSAANMVHLLV